MRYFVTGGSGFVGQALLTDLNSSDCEVRALVRSPQSAQIVRDLGAEPVVGDLGDVEVMQHAMEGVEVVVHLAAETNLAQPRDVFERTNVDGTRNVLEAANRAGVPVFVHISTEAVLADGSPLRGAGADRRPTSRPAGRYSATKGAAEGIVTSADTGMRCVVLRPRFVWGPGDTTLLPELVSAAESGRLMWIDGGGYLTSTTHVSNLVAAIRLVAENEDAVGIYPVTDGEPRPFKDMVSDLLASQGVQPPTRTSPRWAAAALARVSEAIWPLLGRKSKPPITTQELALIGQEMTLDDSRIRDELGFRNVVTMDQGLAELSG